MPVVVPVTAVRVLPTLGVPVIVALAIVGATIKVDTAVCAEALLSAKPDPFPTATTATL